MRLKSLIELGRTPAHRERITREALEAAALIAAGAQPSLQPAFGRLSSASAEPV